MTYLFMIRYPDTPGTSVNIVETTDPMRHLQLLQDANSSPVEYLGSTDIPAKTLHERYAPQRISEPPFFTLSPDLERLIDDLHEEWHAFLDGGKLPTIYPA